MEEKTVVPIRNGIMIEHPVLQCPRCKSKTVAIYSTTRKDGEYIRYYYCDECYLKFKTVEKSSRQ